MDDKLFNCCLRNIKDNDKFEILYNYYYDRIVLHIDEKYHLKELSEDVAQECFECLLKTKTQRGFKFIKHYNSWIYAISENIATRKISAMGGENLGTPVVEQVYDFDGNVDFFGDLQDIVNSLDPDSRSIITLRYVYSYNFKEIAAKVNLTHANVRQKHHRALKRMKNMLKKRDEK